MASFGVQTFNCGGLQLAAKEWFCSDLGPLVAKQPVLMLHGWLDNCASFDGMAPLMVAAGWPVLCLDLAGHGRSGARSGQSAYCVWQDVIDVLAVMDAMQWPTCHLVGHSRGAAVAFLLACCFPDRVLSLTGLEGLFPLVADAAKAPEQLFHAVSTLRKQQQRTPQRYATRDAALLARQSSAFPISQQEAAWLADWGLDQDSRGYAWRYDTKLNAPSEVRLTQEQLAAFIAALTVPTFVFVATQGLLHQDPRLDDFLRQPNRKRWLLEGGHHFHMTQQAGCLVAYWRQQVEAF